MKICKTCILPETFPNIRFDEMGVCNYCRDHQAKRGKDRSVEEIHFEDEEELIHGLEKFKNPKNKYDVLVSLSGGVDSSYAVINIVEKFKLRPLCFHNDFSFADTTSMDNVRRLCRALDVDCIIWRN